MAATHALADSLFSEEVPYCSPSRNAETTVRRPQWLAERFDAAGIPATQKQRQEREAFAPWIRRPREIPTLAFEATRQIGRWATFGLMASAGVYGAFTMPEARVHCLNWALVAVIFVTLSVIATMLSQNADGGFFDTIALYVAVAAVAWLGVAIIGVLLALPIFWGAVGAYLNGLSFLLAAIDLSVDDTLTTKPNTILVDAALQAQGACKAHVNVQEGDDTEEDVSSRSTSAGSSDTDSECGSTECDFKITDWQRTVHIIRNQHDASR